MEIVKKDIREPIVSGLFYPDKAEELKDRVSGLLEEASEYRGASPIIMTPHGSWEECAPCMAAAFASAAESAPDRVILLGPVHREKDILKVHLSSKKYFQTPMGVVKVDQKVCRSLIREGGLFQTDDSPHMEEHALELQLPFIQQLFPEAEIIPMLTGNLKRGDLKKAAAVLKKQILSLPGKPLVVISANLSRYGLADETAVEAEEILQNMDMPLPNPLIEMEKEGKISSCGTRILTLASDLDLFRDGQKARILKRCRTEVSEKKGTMAVFYAGVSWN